MNVTPTFYSCTFFASHAHYQRVHLGPLTTTLYILLNRRSNGRQLLDYDFLRSSVLFLIKLVPCAINTPTPLIKPRAPSSGRFGKITAKGSLRHLFNVLVVVDLHFRSRLEDTERVKGLMSR